jgi:hypothetical protein
MNTLEGTRVVAPALTSPISRPQSGLQAKPEPAAASPAPILITEKEVLFSTAAAMPASPTTTHWLPKATGVVIAAVHGMLLTSSPHGRQPRQYYPKRYEFLENSCLAREMDRL